MQRAVGLLLMLQCANLMLLLLLLLLSLMLFAPWLLGLWLCHYCLLH
jgi:hypothetical protein